MVRDADNALSSRFDSYTVLDVETLTHNKGHPFDPRNTLISYAYKHPAGPVSFKYCSDPDFRTPILEPSSISDVLIGFNFKFDHHWCSHLYPESVKIWDCQLAEHIYTGQRSQYISLNECLEKYGLETKKDIVKEYWDAGVQTDEIPLAVLKEYNEWDVIQTEKLFLVQQELLSEEQKNLVYLLGEDLKVLAHIEAAGIKFDKDGAYQKLNECDIVLKDIEAQLNILLPRIGHGIFNWDSGHDLSCFLYGGTIDFDYAIPEEAVYKSGSKKGQPYTKNRWFVESVVFPKRFEPLEKTETKQTAGKTEIQTRIYQTDAPTLASLKGNKESKSILDLLSKRSETKKVAEMLESLFNQFQTKNWTNDLIHGQLNQNVAVSGRLSASQPNTQNFPPELDKYMISRYD